LPSVSTSCAVIMHHSTRGSAPRPLRPLDVPCRGVSKRRVNFETQTNMYELMGMIRGSSAILLSPCDESCGHLRFFFLLLPPSVLFIGKMCTSPGNGTCVDATFCRIQVRAPVSVELLELLDCTFTRFQFVFNSGKSFAPTP
jgi:hypothetical protein